MNPYSSAFAYAEPLNICSFFQSQAVGDAIYESDWYQQSPKIRKTLLFPLMRSNKSSRIKAGFYEASYPTFAAVRIPYAIAAPLEISMSF